MIKDFPISELKTALSKGKINLKIEQETSKLLSLLFITYDKRRLLIYVSHIHEIIKEDD
jgi:hypothetical protein